MIVGNRSDLSKKRAVSIKQAVRYANAINLIFIETALTWINVEGRLLESSVKYTGV